MGKAGRQGDAEPVPVGLPGESNMLGEPAAAARRVTRRGSR
jgi:hypothetical protein